MVYGCSAKIIKCVVFFFNLLAFLAGVAILVLCVLAYVKNPLKSKLEDFIIAKSDMQSLNIVIYIGMAVGILVIVLGFLGCCGAAIEDGCLLCTFSVLVGLLAGGQIALGVTFLIKKKAVFEAVGKTMKKTQDAANAGDPDACELFNDLSNSFKWCCFNDGSPTHTVLCAKANFTCNADTVGKKCTKEIEKNINTIGIAAGIVLIVIILIEILAIIFATCLCCSMRD